LILIIIEHCGGSTTTKEIEYLTLRQHHSISTLINRMCRVGLVYKEKSPAEKRYRIFMSKEGENLLSKVTEDSIEIVFSNLSINEKLQFTGYLRSLHRQARSLLGVPYRQPATTAH
jgi:DNA-binding MarR family transcriptional regulator